MPTVTASPSSPATGGATPQAPFWNPWTQSFGSNPNPSPTSSTGSVSGGTAVDSSGQGISYIGNAPPPGYTQTSSIQGGVQTPTPQQQMAQQNWGFQQPTRMVTQPYSYQTPQAPEGGTLLRAYPLPDSGGWMNVYYVGGASPHNVRIVSYDQPMGTPLVQGTPSELLGPAGGVTITAGLGWAAFSGLGGGFAEGARGLLNLPTTIFEGARETVAVGKNVGFWDAVDYPLAGIGSMIRDTATSVGESWKISPAATVGMVAGGAAFFYGAGKLPMPLKVVTSEITATVGKESSIFRTTAFGIDIGPYSRTLFSKTPEGFKLGEYGKLENPVPIRFVEGAPAFAETSLGFKAQKSMIETTPKEEIRITAARSVVMELGSVRGVTPSEVSRNIEAFKNPEKAVPMFYEFARTENLEIFGSAAGNTMVPKAFTAEGIKFEKIKMTTKDTDALHLGTASYEGFLPKVEGLVTRMNKGGENLRINYAESGEGTILVESFKEGEWMHALDIKLAGEEPPGWTGFKIIQKPVRVGGNKVTPLGEQITRTAQGAFRFRGGSFTKTQLGEAPTSFREPGVLPAPHRTPKDIAKFEVYGGAGATIRESSVFGKASGARARAGLSKVIGTYEKGQQKDIFTKMQELAGGGEVDIPIAKRTATIPSSSTAGTASLTGRYSTSSRSGTVSKSPFGSASASASASPSISPSLSPSPSRSPSTSPSWSPSPSASPSVSPSTSPSPSPSPSRSPSTSPSPSPSSSPSWSPSPSSSPSWTTRRPKSPFVPAKQKKSKGYRITALRDPLTALGESFRTRRAVLEPLPQTRAVKGAFGAKLFGTQSAGFFFGPKEARAAQRRR